MTVKELIEKLKQMPQDKIVISGFHDSWCFPIDEVYEDPLQGTGHVFIGR